jgi:hypothetical protein
VLAPRAAHPGGDFLFFLCHRLFPPWRRETDKSRTQHSKRLIAQALFSARLIVYQQNIGFDPAMSYLPLAAMAAGGAITQQGLRELLPQFS